MSWELNLKSCQMVFHGTSGFEVTFSFITVTLN